MEVFSFLNCPITVWITAILAFVTFCIVSLPREIFNKIRDWWINRRGISIQEVSKKSGVSEQQIEEIYGGLILDIKQTFLFNFLVLVTSSVATKSLSTDNLLAAFTTTSIYIYWFNLDFFRKNYRLLHTISWILLIINVLILVRSWFIGGDYLWTISFFISVSAIYVLAIKNSLAKKLSP